MTSTKDGSDEPPGPGRNGEKDFKGEKRSNATHASTTDPDARLYRKGGGQPAELCYIGLALMENRSGLMVSGVATRATGDAEPLAAIELRKEVPGMSENEKRSEDHPVEQKPAEDHTHVGRPAGRRWIYRRGPGR